LGKEAQYYLSSELQGEIMTIAEQWKNEGVQQGVQQGIQQGVQRGEAAMLMRLIHRRFGDIPRPLAQQITKADSETLLLWGDKVLEAANLEEIFIDE
jgi:flagellar biosynthesis/type III secretory pathway protein FliH